MKVKTEIKTLSLRLSKMSNKDQNFITAFVKDAHLEGSNMENVLKRTNPRKSVLELVANNPDSVKKWADAMLPLDDTDNVIYRLSFFDAMSRLKENSSKNQSPYNGFDPSQHVNTNQNHMDDQIVINSSSKGRILIKK